MITTIYATENDKPDVKARIGRDKIWENADIGEDYHTERDCLKFID